MAGLYPDAPNAADVPFTEPTLQLLAAARAEAYRLHHEYIGTEHVALGMTHDVNATALLSRFGLDALEVRASLDAIVKPGRAMLPLEAQRPYTSRTLQSFGFAVANARAHGHNAVGIEHLVIGLLTERLNLGASVLQKHGLSLEQVAAEVQQRGENGISGPQ